MTHYLVEYQDNTSLYAAYPNTPNDPVVSMGQYLEDRFTNGGWELVSQSFAASGGGYFVFRPNGK